MIEINAHRCDRLSPLSKLAISLLFVLSLPKLMERHRLARVHGFILAGVVLVSGLTSELKPDSQTIRVWADLDKLLLVEALR